MFQMIFISLLFLSFSCRYVDHWNDEFLPLWTFPINAIGRFFLANFQSGMIQKKGWWIGHGRLSKEAIYRLGMDDIKVSYATKSRLSANQVFDCDD